MIFWNKITAFFFCIDLWYLWSFRGKINRLKRSEHQSLQTFFLKTFNLFSKLHCNFCCCTVTGNMKHRWVLYCSVGRLDLNIWSFVTVFGNYSHSPEGTWTNDPFRRELRALRLIGEGKKIVELLLIMLSNLLLPSRHPCGFVRLHYWVMNWLSRLPCLIFAPVDDRKSKSLECTRNGHSV